MHKRQRLNNTAAALESSMQSTNNADMQPLSIDEDNDDNHNRNEPWEESSSSTSSRSHKRALCILSVIVILIIISILSVVFNSNATSEKYGGVVTSSNNNPNNDNTLSVNDMNIEEDVRTKAPKIEEFKITLYHDPSSYTVIGDIPSDKGAFTQGITYGNGKLYVSTGLYGKSKLRQINKTDGSTIQNINLLKSYFGEGLSLFQNNTKLIQITWKEKTGFIYDVLQPTITEIKTFQFTTTRNEGWGITYDEFNRRFIVSDGSEYLHFWDEDTLTETHKIPVISTTTTKNTTIKKINELEYINGYVFANIWFEDKIIIINPETGIVEHDIDFSMLWPKNIRSNQGADVLNGISIFDNDEILLTGKLWPKIYRIKLNNVL